MDELRSFAYHGMLLYSFTCLYSTLFYQLFNSVLLVLPQPYWLMRFYFLPIYLSIGTVINQNVGFIFFIRGCTSHKSIRYGTFLSPIVKRFSVANVINLVNMTNIRITFLQNFLDYHVSSNTVPIFVWAENMRYLSMLR